MAAITIPAIFGMHSSRIDPGKGVVFQWSQSDATFQSSPLCSMTSLGRSPFASSQLYCTFLLGGHTRLLGENEPAAPSGSVAIEVTSSRYHHSSGNCFLATLNKITKEEGFVTIS